MEVKKLSEEMVKIETKNLNEKIKKEKLTVLDICQPNVYTTLCYFFGSEEASTIMSIDNLKKGLLIALKEFPEMAGRIRDEENGRYIHHTNDGVILIFSKANFDYQAIKNVNLRMSNLPEKDIFLPEFKHPFGTRPQDPVLVLHLVHLTDGSALLATGVHHHVCDAQGMFYFINSFFSVN